MKMNNSKEYTLEEIIELYDSAGIQSRNMSYLLRWLHNLYESTYLSSIDPSYRERLALDKAKLTCFNTMIDDLADNYKIRDKDLLEKAIRIPNNAKKPYSNKYVEVIRKIWVDLISSIENYPRYEEFKDIFYFDLDQFFSTVKYGFLVNTIDLDNIVETTTYSYHNMMAILFCDMDLMCSSNFDKRELGKLRPILHWVQDICHIGNILSTYPREIEELDFSSPIISMALFDNTIEKDDIIKRPRKVLKDLKYLEPYFERRAEEDFQKIKDYVNTVESVDISDFYIKIRKVYESFLQRPYYWKLGGIEEKEGVIEPIVPLTPNNTPKWVRM